MQAVGTDQCLSLALYPPSTVVIVLYSPRPVLQHHHLGQNSMPQPRMINHLDTAKHTQPQPTIVCQRCLTSILAPAPSYMQC